MALSSTGPKDFAIIVGINFYHDKNSFKTLQGAIQDATFFKKWLASQSVVLYDLIPPATEVNAVVTYESIIAQLREIFKAAIRQRGRRIYIYFAGHGFAQNSRDSSLITSDADPENDFFSISSDELIEYLYVTPFFDEIVFISDCCRVKGKIFPSWELPFHKPEDDFRRLHFKRRFAAHAVGYGYTAREYYDKSDQSYRGIFSKALEESIRYGQTMMRESFTTTHLSERLPMEIKKVSAVQKLEQDPKLDPYGDKAITLISRNSITHVKIIVKKAIKAKFIRLELFNSQSEQIGSINAEANQFSAVFQLKTGIYYFTLILLAEPFQTLYFDINDQYINTNSLATEYVVIKKN